MATVYERVKDIAVDKSGKDPSEVQESSSFSEDLNADSLDLVELIMAFEEEFTTDGNQVEISDEDAGQIQTLNDAVCRTFIGHQHVIPSQEEFLTFSTFWIDNNTLNGTDLDALWNLEVSNTFGTVIRFDFVNFFSLVDGIIWALRLANIAIDAFICDYQCHNRCLNTKRTQFTD